MKKLLSVLLIITIILSTAPCAFASNPVEVYLNGAVLEKTGIIISDYTYLPVRALCEALNKAVNWDDDTKSVLIGTMPPATEKTDTVNIYLDGIRMENAEAVIIDGTTYLPVRALCEALDMEVLWDGEKRQVHVIEKLKLEYPIDIIAASEGFMQLSATEKERFISYTTNTLPLGRLMRQKLTEGYMDNYNTLSAIEQKSILLQMLSETAYFRTGYYGSLLPDGESAKYEIVSKTFNSSYDVWRGTKKPVTIHHVKMESGYEGVYHEWNMISSTDSPVVTDTIEAMSRFPYGIRRFVKTVVYDPDPINTCYGGGNTLWLRISWLPSEDHLAKEILSCIIGYVFDANITIDKTLWDDAIKNDIVPVSGFGNTNRVSDLGEFNSLYHIAKSMENGLAELERVYPNRFALYAAMLYSCDTEYYADYRTYYESLYSAAAEEEAASGYFTISIPFTKLYLTHDITGDGFAHFEEFTGADNQLWSLSSIGENTVIKSKASGMLLSPQMAIEDLLPGGIYMTDPKGFFAFEADGRFQNIVMEKVADDTCTIYFTQQDCYLGQDANDPSRPYPVSIKTNLLIKMR